MAKVKLKYKDGHKRLGKIVFDVWEEAIKANPEAPAIDRKALVAKLNEVLDLEDKGTSNKRIEFDVVFDTDLDANTRLVWLSVPTPETEGIGGRQTWAEWKHDYYDRLTPAEKDKKEEELGASMLFGCGR